MLTAFQILTARLRPSRTDRKQAEQCVTLIVSPKTLTYTSTGGKAHAPAPDTRWHTQHAGRPTAPSPTHLIHTTTPGTGAVPHGCAPLGVGLTVHTQHTHTSCLHNSGSAGRAGGAELEGGMAGGAHKQAGAAMRSLSQICMHDRAVSPFLP